VRLLWVLCVLFAGTGVLAYIVAWIIIPEAPYELPEQSSVGSVNSTGPTV
jgi:phage shock protein PspC (stress-responsive transcriptional regulator)